MRNTLLACAAALGLLAAAPAAAQQACGGFYTVQPGDNLTGIALRCATSVPALLAANPSLRSGTPLEAGGTLRIPAPDQPAPTPFEACGAFYTLGPGDALAAVAARCGVTVPLLVAVNPGLENPDNFRPGGKVRIPDVPAAGGYEPVIVGARAAVVGGGADDTVSTPAADPAPYIRYEGVLVAGDGCTILRTADGTEVGIVGGLGPGFEAGDRVAVTGPLVEDADCGTDRAIRVSIMWRPGG